MRRLEVNEGEMFGVSDKIILGKETESVIALGSKVGVSQDQIFYMFTYSGKLVNKDRSADFTVLMSLEDAFNHANQIIEGIVAVMEANGLTPPEVQARDDEDQPPLDLDIPEYDYTQHSGASDGATA